MIRTILQLGAGIFVGVLFAVQWPLTMILSRSSTIVFLPNAIRFLGAGVVLFIALLAVRRQVPQLSLRLFQSAISQSVFAYVLTPVLCWYALRSLSSSFVALVFLSVPYFFFVLHSQHWKKDAALAAVFVLALGAYYLGIKPDNELRADTLVPLKVLISGAVLFGVAVWFSRRLLWLHSATELNLISLCVASGMHFLLAFFSGEFQILRGLGNDYFLLLGILALTTALAFVFCWVTAFYFGAASVFSATLSVPLASLLLGFSMWQETPLNLVTLGAGLTIAGLLVWGGVDVRYKRWLCHFLLNDMRHADRLVCQMKGVLKLNDGTFHRIRVVDVTARGIGFLCREKFKTGDEMVLALPIGEGWNQLTLQCKVSHQNPITAPPYAFRGGLEFTAASDEIYQIIVEFIARIAKERDNASEAA